MTPEWPTGMILLWGNDDVPTGWQICDGTNGTPDLRGKFVRGCASDAALRTAGGAETHTHPAGSTNTVSHAHSGVGSLGSAPGGVGVKSATGTGVAAAGHDHNVTSLTMTSASHSHTYAATSAVSNLPLYVVRRYIMKL